MPGIYILHQVGKPRIGDMSLLREVLGRLEEGGVQGGEGRGDGGGEGEKCGMRKKPALPNDVSQAAILQCVSKSTSLCGDVELRELCGPGRSPPTPFPYPAMCTSVCFCDRSAVCLNQWIVSPFPPFPTLPCRPPSQLLGAAPCPDTKMNGSCSW